MGRLFIIKKVKTVDNIHYYSVFKENSFDEISYFMALDSVNKKIFFFDNDKMEDVRSIYDVSNDRFEKQDARLKSIIGSSAVIKGIKAILSNNFPPDISVQS